jgi:hypothetical protein
MAYKISRWPEEAAIPERSRGSSMNAPKSYLKINDKK